MTKRFWWLGSTIDWNSYNWLNLVVSLTWLDTKSFSTFGCTLYTKSIQQHKLSPVFLFRVAKSIPSNICCHGVVKMKTLIPPKQQKSFNYVRDKTTVCMAVLFVHYIKQGLLLLFSLNFIMGWLVMQISEQLFMCICRTWEIATAVHG